MIKPLFYIIIFLMFNLSSCTLLQTADKTEGLLPRETEIPGWITDGPSTDYTADNLREYLKEPEKIQLLNTYGFKKLSVAKYNNISKPGKQVIVEIYTMDSSMNAFGIFSIERIEDPKEENECEDSFSASPAFFFRKENYYFKISADKYIDSIADCKIFSKIICDKIKTNDPLPGYLSLFGKEDNRKSLVYRIEGHPKFPVLNKIYTRKTDISGEIKTVFFTKRGSSYISNGEFSNLLKNNERQFILSSTGESQTAFLKLDDNDYIFISVFKEWIFGIMDAETMFEGEKVINYLYKDLIDFLRNIR